MFRKSNKVTLLFQRHNKTAACPSDGADPRTKRSPGGSPFNDAQLFKSTTDSTLNLHVLKAHCRFNSKMNINSNRLLCKI